MYPLARSTDRGPAGTASSIPVVKDLWMGGTFSVSMMLPPQHISFKSSAAAAKSRPLQLQIPSKSFDFLECIYGNWKVPSSKHAAMVPQCYVKE